MSEQQWIDADDELPIQQVHVLCRLTTKSKGPITIVGYWHLRRGWHIVEPCRPDEVASAVYGDLARIQWMSLL